ncbi:suppressor of cytokine signaling 3-like [Conger conger]|uniref:suppressor of cytokine signaling 3-like n=1 Tax=Conger conger TaxID=82655 RepID=UPI002A5A7B37|nr:suppressor of cytokine signaling 3-like [Conger conger]XP_061087020.1 suppressor of cytokine signaling 3-like [Conger conger]
MVTQSGCEVMESGGATRYRTFSSRRQQQLVTAAERKLQESGFYWGPLSGREAGALLGPQPPGTFLLRDSAHQQHFFTLSLRTATGTKNLRIDCDSTAFSLQTDPSSPHNPPRFTCLLQLLQHYMALGPSSSSPSPSSSSPSPSSSSPSPSSSSPSPSYFISSGGEKVPLELLRPLCSSMVSLQHLCRRTLNGHLEACREREGLPPPLQDFLQEYDAAI